MQASDGKQEQHFSAIARDISERKRYEDELTHQAKHDQLTGLANRALFEDRLKQAIHHAQRSGLMIAVVFIDLDNFKLVNDTMAHAFGATAVGEGVETQAQADALRSYGCDQLQGYLFGRPMDAAEFQVLLKRESAR